uniref:Type II secretion system protein GspF domain-containing protein n=1 Tax=Thermocrinis ruber TaxID=75906 RepID=A0A7C5X4B6_9AQUI
MEKLQIDLQRKYDDAVIEVVGRLYGRKADVYLIDLLEEMYPKEKRFEEVKALIRKGEDIFTALYKKQLISSRTYEYLSSARRIRGLKEFVMAYRDSTKEIRDVVNALRRQLISPTLALLMHYAVFWTMLYKILPAFPIDQKTLSFLPSYFPFLIYASKNPWVFYAYFGLTLGVVGLLYFNQDKFNPAYRMAEKMKFYLYLYQSTKAGKKVEEAVKAYRGRAIDVGKFNSAMAAGKSLGEAILQSMRYPVSPVERTLLISALEGDEKEIPKNIEDLYREMLDMTKVIISRIGNVLSFVAMAVVAGVLLFFYGGFYLPLIEAVRHSVG